MRKIFLVPYTFVVMNWAPVVGLYYFLRQGTARNIWLDYKLDAGWSANGRGADRA